MIFISFNSNTMGASSGARTVYPFWAPEFSPNFSCCSIFSFVWNVLWTIVCLFSRPLHCLFFFWFIASDYNFGIFKLVLKFHIYVLYFVLLFLEVSKFSNGNHIRWHWILTGGHQCIIITNCGVIFKSLKKIFYTDISCLGGVFANNTSLETKFPLPICLITPII